MVLTPQSKKKTKPNETKHNISLPPHQTTAKKKPKNYSDKFERVSLFSAPFFLAFFFSSRIFGFHYAKKGTDMNELKRNRAQATLFRGWSGCLRYSENTETRHSGKRWPNGGRLSIYI